MKNSRFGGGGYGVRDLTRAAATSMSVALGDQSCDCLIGDQGRYDMFRSY